MTSAATALVESYAATCSSNDDSCNSKIRPGLEVPVEVSQHSFDVLQRLFGLETPVQVRRILKHNSPKK
jgi:hypothetical protein